MGSCTIPRPERQEFQEVLRVEVSGCGDPFCVSEFEIMANLSQVYRYIYIYPLIFNDHFLRCRLDVHGIYMIYHDIDIFFGGGRNPLPECQWAVKV